MTINELNLFKQELGYSESGNDYNNDLGQYWGKYQFGNARRLDISKILGITPPTREQFTPTLQEKFFEVHINDYEQRIIREGLNKYFGVIVQGKANNIVAKINKYGLLAGAHLGGFTGMKNFLLSNHTNDRKDSLGTHISDYIAKFSLIMEKKTV